MPRVSKALQKKATEIAQILQNFSNALGIINKTITVIDEGVKEEQAAAPKTEAPATPATPTATPSAVPNDWAKVEGSEGMFDLPSGQRVQLVNK